MAFSASSRRALANGWRGVAGQGTAARGCWPLVKRLGLVVIAQPRSIGVAPSCPAAWAVNCTQLLREGNSNSSWSA